MAEASSSGTPNLDGSLSFLDELMGLEGLEDAALAPDASSNFAGHPWEAPAASRQAGSLSGLAGSRQQPATSYAGLPHEAAQQPDTPCGSLGQQFSGHDIPDLPELPMDLAYLDALPQPGEAASQRERARATQKRFRSRQKVPVQLLNASS